MSDEPENEKKIIIDEDWKDQVEAERAAGETDPAQQPEPGPGKEPGPLPQPTLTFLASSIYLQGIISLGMLPGPGSDKCRSTVKVW